MSTILGINQSAYASACILKEGKIIAAIGEERLNRIKYFGGFPALSIKKVIEIAGVDPSEIDIVAIGTRCGIFDSNKAQKKEYRFTTRLVSFLSKFIPARILGSKILRVIYVKIVGYFTKKEFFKNNREYFLELGISLEKIKFYDHHSCHAAAAYYCHPWNKREPVLVFTCDGNGDGICASVSIGKEQDLCKKIEISSIHSIGGLYSRVVKFLGMSPWHDEYKVMGLAPWGNKKKAQDIVNKFNKLWTVSGLRFFNKTGYAADSLVNFFNREFKNTRFDHIACALQGLTENLLKDWVENNINHFGIRKIALCGGVFLNIKANQKISEIKNLTDLYIFPSSSDDSISVGAALLASRENNDNPTLESPIESMYLGESISTLKEKFINDIDPKLFSVTEYKNINYEIAKLLSENELVARCSGRMEYGPRALGNRSILANPSNVENINKINKLVKSRDFWMPFGVTVLDKFQERYIVNPKKIFAPYMIISFNTKSEFYSEIVAGTHQCDYTIRPQILSKNDNQDYYDLIEKFYEKTGIGAVLNTSLNLHGDPLVNSPCEALEILNKTQLKYLVVDEFLITKIFQKESY